MKKNDILRGAVESNRRYWSRVGDDQCIVFGHSTEDRNHMRALLNKKRWKYVFVLASSGVLTNDFLLFLMREKLWYNKKCRNKIRKEQNDAMRLRYNV